MRRLALLLAFALLPFTATTAQEHRRLTNLPHLYINTFTGRDITSKTVEVWSRMWLVDEHDEVNYYDSVAIRGRGNSTWDLAKKPYRIKLPKKERLLGDEHANAKKWTLLANHGDKSLMRNALASYVGDLCGQVFTPAAQFVDLTINGTYRGCYQLSDQVDVRKRRVDIEEQDLPLRDDSNISGGYLIEADGFADFTNGVSGWYTTRGVPMTIHYPDDNDIDPRQFAYIRQFVNSFESRLFSTNYTDAARGYRPYVDSLSLASWYVASEVIANPDYVWSMYFYKDRDDDRLYFGPLWDHDIAFNNDNRLNNADPTHNLMADIAFTNNGMENWVKRMWNDKWFQRLVFRHYIQLYQDGLETKLLAKIDSLHALLDQSQQLNYQRWNIRTRTLREVVLYSTYEEYVDDLRRFVTARVPALLSAFAARQADAVDIDDFVKVTPGFFSDADTYYAISNAGTATVFDLDTEGRLVANAPDKESHSQQWQITTLSNGYQQLLNRMNGMALCDPTVGASTETTNLNTQITVAPADSTDKAQQWHIVAQADGCYNLNNRKTRHTANLTGGNGANGTAILSYTNDSRNASSNNRLWRFLPTGTGASGIHDTATPIDYALAYDRQLKRLHFGADDIQQLSFIATVYDQAGRPVLQFPASQGGSVGHLPHGVYVVGWYHHGQHAVKLAL